MRGVALMASLALLLGGCGSAPPRSALQPEPGRAAAAVPAPSAAPAGEVLLQGKSRWVPVNWSDLPGFGQDNWVDGWSAWVRSCGRSSPVWVALCPQVRSMSIASEEEQRSWVRDNFLPYRVESLQGEAQGVLTGYFEPELAASRVPTADFSVPLYGLPTNTGARKPWYTRQEIDTLPAAQAALAQRVIAYVADPVDAMVMQIQGSGRLRIARPDGTSELVRLAFAGTNEQPYASLGRWLLDRGLVKDASWPGIKAWLADNPQRRQELLWSNPRVVFFREEALAGADAGNGPRGSQGVALTPQRSVAVDAGSIPLGTPLWLVSEGGQTSLQRLVLAQDTGSAISGAVRADYFAGWGADAAELAGRLHQSLQLWAIWPK